MAGQRTLRELIVIGFAPVKFMHQRAQHHSAVDHASGDDNIGTGGQDIADGRSAEVGINTQAAAGQRLVAEHIFYAGKISLTGAEVIALYGADAEVQPGFGD